MRFHLGDYVPYLLNKAGAELDHSLARDLEGFGLSLPMWRVLAALLEEGEVRLGDLARRSSTDLSTLSRIAAALEVRGLLRRRRCGEDARAVLATLTVEGRRLSEAIVPLALDRESSAVAGMSDEEVRLLKGLLMRLSGNVAAAATVANDANR